MHSFIFTKKVPQVLAISANRVKEWALHSWKWLNRVRFAVLNRINEEKRLSSRTMRVEQRNAISSLLEILLSHLDLKTMQIGVYNSKANVFVHLSLDYLANKARLSLRRTQRAMAWLYESGYVIGYRQSSFDMEKNEYSHKPSIRKITNFLFQDLGITELALQRARNRSLKKSEKHLISFHRKQQSKLSQPDVSLYIKEVASNLSNTFFPKAKIISAESLKIYTEKIKKLMTSFPNLSHEEAKKMLPSPHVY